MGSRRQAVGGGLNDEGRLSRVQVGAGTAWELGLDHEHELCPVVAVIQHGRRVLGLWRQIADARGDRVRTAGNLHPHRVARAEGAKPILGHEEPHLDVAGRQERDHGVARGHKLPHAVQGIEDQPGAGRGLDLLADAPVGGRHRGLRLPDLGLGGGDRVASPSQPRRLQVRGETFRGLLILLVGQAGMVVLALGNRPVPEQALLPRQVEPRELRSGAGPLEPGLEGGDFRRAGSLFQVLQPGAGGMQPGQGLAPGVGLGAIVQGEKGSAGLDPGTLFHGELFELTGDRRGDVDEFPLDIALPARGFPPGAPGEGEGRKQSQKNGAHGIEVTERGNPSKLEKGGTRLVEWCRAAQEWCRTTQGWGRATQGRCRVAQGWGRAARPAVSLSRPHSPLGPS